MSKWRRQDRGTAGVAFVPVWVLILGLMASGAIGCDGERERQTSASTDVEPAAPDAGSDAGQKREAYGLPLPPAVDRVERTDTMVEVETSLSVDELASYFERKLTDYEVFRLGDAKLEVVGLRSFMPAIRAHQVGPLTKVTYIPSREPPEPKQMADTGVGGSSERESALSEVGSTRSRVLLGPSAGGSGPQPAREPGTPVEVRTEDGELLAPGAEWGEPYTPPPGSPLDKPRFESNFGLPFGEWHMD